MSKNFNLSQQAEIYLSNVPTLRAEAVADETKTRTMADAGAMPSAESVIREESLRLVQRLFRPSGQVAPKAVIFAAVDSQNGCSSLCVDVARMLAENIAGSVCLVECNFRMPTLPKLLRMENHYGLADALRQEGSIKNFAKQIGPANCWFLSAGSLPQDSLNLLTGDRMKERVSELRKEFDYVVVDAPPLNAYADAMALGRIVDGLVLVLEANETRREAALRVTDGLRSSKIPVLGAVLNNRTFPIPSALYKRL